MAIRITCINKAGGQHYDPHTAISDLGWTNDATGKTGKSTRQVVYDWLKQNSANQAYVTDAFGNRAYLYPRTDWKRYHWNHRRKRHRLPRALDRTSAWRLADSGD